MGCRGSVREPMRTLDVTLTTVAVAALAACSGDDGGDGGTEPGGPRVVELRTDRASFSEGEDVTFTAIATDPDGLADLAGATLSAGDGALFLGAFVASEPGTFTFTLSWSRLHAVQPIEFETSPTRELRVDVLDQAGHRGWATTGVTLTCPAGAACGGACVDLATDDGNCGQCGHVCPAQGEFGGCAARSCQPVLSACFNGGAHRDCAAACAAEGSTCVARGCGGNTAFYFTNPVQCGSVIGFNPQPLACGDAIPNVDLARCCCEP